MCHVKWQPSSGTCRNQTHGFIFDTLKFCSNGNLHQRTICKSLFPIAMSNKMSCTDQYCFIAFKYFWMDCFHFRTFNNVWFVGHMRQLLTFKLVPDWDVVVRTGKQWVGIQSDKQVHKRLAENLCLRGQKWFWNQKIKPTIAIIAQN